MEVVTVIVGSALGAAFELLFAATIKAEKRARTFPKLLSELKSNLESLLPLIPQIEQSGTNSVSESFTRKMEEGNQLVEKCEDESFAPLKYGNKIRKLDKSLQRLLRQLNVQLGTNLAQNLNLNTDWCAVPPLPSVTVGLDGPLEELKMKLLRDDKVSMLVLTAPGGCGKTTLAKMFCHDQEVKDKFKYNIFFANVSNKHSYHIVQELCQHAGLPVPALQNEAIAFNWLQRFMRETGQNPLLLVLDDVRIGSKSLLDKFAEFKMPNYKILVTSRYHFPTLIDPPYQLKQLKDEDAMSLFRRSTFPPNTSSIIPDDLQKKIVECCKRFPLAITVTGKSLRNQRFEKWRTRLTELSEGSSILHSEDSLSANLKSCLDDLDKGMVTVKDCFIDFGLFPGHQRIPVAALLDVWAELNEGAGDNVSMENIYELTARNLASLVITSTLFADGVFPTELDNMDLPKAKVLVLNFQTKNYALPKFMKRIRKLKVLIVTNSGVSPAELSNFELLGSLSNLKRIRLERISISLISKNNIQLKTLEKISLFMCNFVQDFKNSSTHILKAFPNLVELNIDYCNDLVEFPSELCDLIHLKMLSITNCHKLSALPEEIEKLVNVEVLRLRSCTDLVRLPGSIEKLAKLYFLDLHNCFGIKELPEGIGKMICLRKINMGQCSRLEMLPPSAFDLDQQLEKVICDEDTKNLWEPVLSSLDKITVVKEEFNLNWLHKLQF